MPVDLAFMIYPVADLARALRFYCDILGLTPSGAWEGSWYELQVGGGTLVLTTRYEEFGIQPGAAGALLAIEVEELSDYVTLFKANKISWSIEPKEYAHCRGGTVVDPDGNRLLLHQKKAISKQSS